MSLKVKTLIAFIVIAALILPWQLFAGVCVQRAVVKQRVVSYAYAQPVYQAVAYQAVSPYSYAIGSDLVLEALAEKLALRIEEKLVERQREAAPPPSIVVEKCAKCHSPQSRIVVEEGVPAFFNELGQLTATPEQRAGMKVAARLGSMPPPPAKELTDDEYIEIRRELERGLVRPAQPQTQPAPPIPNGPRDYPPPVSRSDMNDLQRVPLPPTPSGDPRTRPPENIPEPPATTEQ